MIHVCDERKNKLNKKKEIVHLFLGFFTPSNTNVIIRSGYYYSYDQENVNNTILTDKN